MKHSPMLQHAIESFAHGLEHFLDGTERSRKFALLHIDQAVELFLKEKSVRIGKSIYKTDGTTLSLHETFRSLDKTVDIPERPRLEELHDLRNTVQHKGLTPDAATTEFYVHLGYGFAKRFLRDELNIPIDTVLSSQHRAPMEGPPEATDEAEIAETLREAIAGPTPADKIVRGYATLSRAASALADKTDGRIRFRTTLRNAAVARGATREKIDDAIRQIFTIRGQVLSSGFEPSETDAQQYLHTVRRVLRMVGYDPRTMDNVK